MKKILLSFCLITLSIIAIATINVSAETYGNLTYSVSDGEATITRCDRSANGEIIIPDTIDGYPVTSLGEEAFSGCSKLTSITIPGSVISIGDIAFHSCINLTTVKLLDGVTSIGRWSFQYCTSLENITIPDSVTSIGDWAFYHCTNLANITIPDSVMSIGNSAFDMTGYYNNSDNWEDGALYINKHLSNVKESISGDYTVRTGTTSIGGAAFYDCNSLISITIPNSTTSIGNGAFWNCSNLKNVYYYGTQAEWDKILIGEDNTCLTNATINFVTPRTETTISNNKKTFTITPINIENGSTVILALYDGRIFVEMQSAVYSGEAITFTTTKTYTNAKVMVWNDITNLKPVCEVENVQ